jgi:HlyD family secretion protein
MGTGTLEARVEATVSPKIQGRLVEVLVDQNDFVTAEQPLAVLDGAELKEQVAVAQATLDAALATIDRVRAEENRARAVLNQALLSHARALDLMKANVAAQADLDKAIELMQVAEADVQRAQAAIVEAERQRLTALASLNYQQARLADTRIMSPFAGLVVRRDRDPGDVVVPGASILQLISTNELWISAWVDETGMAALAPGQPARVVFRSQPTQYFTGSVARLGRQTDRETREFIVDVLVEQLPANWAVGQRAEVYIETDRKDSVLTVPEAFVIWRDGAAGVLVDDTGTARWRSITIGLRGNGVIEVTAGLQGVDRVVKPAGPPGVSLKDGQRIRVP